MADYGRLDPYRKARYDQGVDAKIVIMGNTGALRSFDHANSAGYCHLLSCGLMYDAIV